MEFVLYEAKDRIAAITLNRPEQRNAQNTQLLDELDACWTMAAQDEDVRVIVLKANGPHFSSGHDISTKPGRPDRGRLPEEGARGDRRLRARSLPRLLAQVARRPEALDRGGAGRMHRGRIDAVCWPCDLIVASENAFFSDPVVRMGIGGVEYHGHTWEFGARKAKELLFTAGRFDAQEAHRLGMVNRVVPTEKLEEEAFALARQIAQMHPFALAQAKRMVNSTLDIIGQYSAMQTAFDIHTTGHGHALSVSDRPMLVDLEAMKKTQK